MRPLCDLQPFPNIFPCPAHYFNNSPFLSVSRMKRHRPLTPPPVPVYESSRSEVFPFFSSHPPRERRSDFTPQMITLLISPTVSRRFKVLFSGQQPFPPENALSERSISVVPPSLRTPHPRDLPQTPGRGFSFLLPASIVLIS